MIRQTSLLSYRDVLPQLSERYVEYLDALREIGHPATDQEVSRFAGHGDPNYFRPRRNELVKQGLLVECEARKCSVSGKTALTWWFL